MPKLDKPFREKENVHSSDLGFKTKKFIYSFWLISVDSHLFADPDPGSQNVADPTDPNHWFKDWQTKGEEKNQIY